MMLFFTVTSDWDYELGGGWIHSLCPEADVIEEIYTLEQKLTSLTVPTLIGGIQVVSHYLLTCSACTKQTFVSEYEVNF